MAGCVNCSLRRQPTLQRPKLMRQVMARTRLSRSTPSRGRR